ncbi:MAG: Succinyl-diaminopimelate desuccinylase [Phycisphaerae bacterium]|nr:Succinyl-diaminopimelate desuccinylase [Phycisphaerae bacterium]
MNNQLNYIREHEQEFIERLNSWLRIPSISTASEHRQDVQQAAGYIRQILDQAGMRTERWETARHPAIFAEGGSADGPTVLIYGHYDVQPAGDAKLWHSPPFEPTLREGALYARGTADDKGQILAHVLAVEAWLKTVGKLPLRVKLLIEGEEEIGSPNLATVVREHRQQLACDVVVLSDTSKLSPEIPGITYGTKGLIYKELKVSGPKQNLHSGLFGGTIANPGQVLAQLLAALKDDRQRVAIPGFYEQVLEVSAQERQALAELPVHEQQLLRDLGSPQLDGEHGYSTLERQWCRPTVEINGLFGGYMGEGAMTIIPASVGAKVSMRIVPYQQPAQISQLFDDYLQSLCPPTVRLEIHTHSMTDAYLTPPDLPALAAARRAVEKGFGRAPAMIRSGGTIPIMALFRRELQAESLLIGFAHPHCNLHGPNEFFHISDFMAGIRTSAQLLEELAAR